VKSRGAPFGADSQLQYRHHSQHCGNVRRSIWMQIDQRRRRQRAMRGIQDDPAGGKRQPVGFRCLAEKRPRLPTWSAVRCR
jgi:hypothetical protein